MSNKIKMCGSTGDGEAIIVQGNNREDYLSRYELMLIVLQRIGVANINPVFEISKRRLKKN